MRGAFIFILFLHCIIQASTITYLNQFTLNDRNYEGMPTNILDLNIGYKAQNGGVNIAVEKPIKPAKLIYDISELYFQKTYNPLGISITIGRKVIDWSPLDQYWKMGLVNNRKKFNYVDMGQSGLTALSITKAFEGFYITGLFSYIYFPEDPRCRIRGNQIVCSTIWSAIPPKNVSIFNKNIPVKYSMNYGYDTFKPTVGLTLGKEKEDYTFNIFYIYKPETHTRLNINFYISIKENTVNVLLDPVLYYNHVYGGNFNYKLNRNTGLQINYLASVPINKTEKPYPYMTLYEKRHMQSFVNLGLTTLVNLGLTTCKVDLNYLYATKYYESSLYGIFAPTMWPHAVGLDVEKNITSNLIGVAHLKFNPLLKYYVVWPEVKYSINKEIYLFVGAYIIGANTRKSFWYSHRNKDSAYLGVTYNF